MLVGESAIGAGCMQAVAVLMSDGQVSIFECQEADLWEETLEGQLQQDAAPHGSDLDLEGQEALQPACSLDLRQHLSGHHPT